MAEVKTDTEKDQPVYILITQCLQNGFLLADENRLCLPAETVKQMLIGQQDTKTHISPKNRREFGRDVKSGPLYRFFESVISPYSKQEIKDQLLHVVHIKDWHYVSPEYDAERNAYGAHCEAGSWDAEPIDGFDRFLKPWGDDKVKQKAAQGKGGYVEGNVIFYEVLSDSVFDFRPDKTIKLDDSFGIHPEDELKNSHLQLLLERLIGFDHVGKRIYVVMIGVYTDIKIKMLLTGLRTRYTIDNLITSDLLTAAPSLERHLEGLDFAAKVLNVEIIHSLNELASTLNPIQDATAIPQSLTKNTINFRDYKTYFLDKQNILGFQDQRLMEYLNLTSTRSLQVYDTIYHANLNLIRIGLAFLFLTILLIIVRAFNPHVPADLLLATGGLGTAQILASFFATPFDRMRQNLTAMVRLRNYLETYSNLSALLRHHLTLAERLQPNLHDDETYTRAVRELELLERQIKLVETASTEMTHNFPDLVVSLAQIKQAEVANSQAALAAATTNPSASASTTEGNQSTANPSASTDNPKPSGDSASAKSGI